MENDFVGKKLIFQTSMLSFWYENGRHQFPWRKTKDPWKLLLAEVLLRKTTSEQAIPVYEKLSIYSPVDLIKINITTLESILLPLGINKIRAKQLITAAKFFSSRTLISELTDSELCSLPGVGRYISNMVRTNAYGIPAPGLDANMIRVLTRFFGFQSTRKRPREDSSFWKFAESLIPQQNPCEFNWGVLDFSALVCTFRKPKCDKCLLQANCNFVNKSIPVFDKGALNE